MPNFPQKNIGLKGNKKNRHLIAVNKLTLFTYIKFKGHFLLCKKHRFTYYGTLNLQK